MPDRGVRAGDADRERTVESLRQHYAEGRLEREEFDERVESAYTAKTLGDLAGLLADLPAEPASYALPVPAARSSIARSAADRRREVALRRQVGAWASVSLVCWTIYLITVATGSGWQGLWPIWVSGPWGAVLLGRWVTGRLG